MLLKIFVALIAAFFGIMPKPPYDKASVASVKTYPIYPEHKASWGFNPGVILCEGFSSHLDEEDVADILLFYYERNLLEEIPDIKWQVCGPCPLEAGYIVITSQSCTFEETEDDYDVVAWTYSISYARKLLAARIELSYRSDNNTLLHEFGHALGYGHSSMEGHVMYPISNGIGTIIDGM